jgi:flagellar hook-basal body complex protein FliE
MNQLSAVRAAFPTLESVQALRPDAANAARVIRPGDLRELTPSQVSPATSAKAADGSFSSMLGKMVSEVSQKQNVASQTVAALQSGQPVTLHQAMISMEEASVSFSLMAEVRNKLLDSYQELMRMQV